MVSNVLREVTEQAEAIKNNAPASVGVEIGDVVRQGDLYLVRIHELPKSRKKRSNRQLADGDTQGSRHVLRGKAQLYDVDAQQAIALLKKADRRFDVRDYQVGPGIQIEEPATVEHPEHGHRTLTEPGCYLSIFQRSLTAEQLEERARD